MKTRLLTLFALTAALSGGFLVLEEIEARTLPGGIIEKRVNANLMRVRIDGRWQEFPLMPLDERACTSGDDHLEQYCD